MEYKPVFTPFTSRPKTQHQSGGSFLVSLRDTFSISTWLLLGAILHGLVALIIPTRLALLVAVPSLVVLVRSAREALAMFGVLNNPAMDGVVPGRSVPVIPDNYGDRQEPAAKQLCCILLGARSNHPLGIFGPGFKESGDRFVAMIQELSANATEHGFLGASNWLSTERYTSNENLSVLYFESLEALHNFAHGPTHTRAVEWWAKEAKNMPHISLNHEILLAPQNLWEATYLNNAPTGLGATSKEIEHKTEAGIVKSWVNPLVNGNGRLRYSKGRMNVGFDNAKEWAAHENAASMETADGKYDV